MGLASIRTPLARSVAILEKRADLSDYDFKRHAGTVEFVSGGPPCQPFSIGSKHKGMDDRRNMFPHAVRALR